MTTITMLVVHTVILIGYFGAGNFGDDLLLRALLTRLGKIRGCFRVKVLAVDSSKLPRLDGYPFDISFMTPKEFLVRRPNFGKETVLFGSGGQFHHHKRNVRGFSLESLEPLTLIFLKVIFMKLFFRSRVFAYLVGIGPFDTQLSQFIWRQIRHVFDGASVRDQVSQSWMSWATLGVDPSLTELSDLEFVGIAEATKESARVSVVLRYWPRAKAPFEIVENLLKAFDGTDSQEYSVTFYCFERTQDQPLIEFLRLRGHQVVVWEATDNLEEFVTGIKDSKIILSMRAHGLYLASVLGVPAAGIAIEPKIDIACETLGFPVLSGKSEDELSRELTILFDKLASQPVKTRRFEKSNLQANNDLNSFLTTTRGIK